MKKKKVFICIVAAVLCCLSLISPCVSAAGGSDEPYYSYTYWDDDLSGSKIASYSKDIYRTEKVIDQRTVNRDIAKLTDVCVSPNGEILLLDGGASRIYVFSQNYDYLRTIENIKKLDTVLDFTNASGIYSDGNSNIYIADTDNNRVIICDSNGTYVNEIGLPDSELIPDDYVFRPIKLTKDSKGYIYILSDGSYYGALLYSPDLEFVGFYGANTVEVSLLDTLSNFFEKIFTTTEKRALQEKKLPYQFVDLYIDSKDFVYTCTGRFTSDTKAETGQIKRLNPAGENVLMTEDYNYADEDAGGMIYGVKATQDLLGVAVDDDGYIYTLDSTYGRIFVYNKDSKLLGTFGIGLASGKTEGTFNLPCALDVIGDDVIVCDSSNNNLTVFTITDYGKIIKQADGLTKEGFYEEAGELWEDIISQDANCQMAYSGLAKAALYKEDYELAMKYAEIGLDRDAFAQAFKQNRTSFLKNHFGLFFVIILIFVGALAAFLVVTSKKQIQFIKNEKVRVLAQTPIHPFDCFEKIKYKKMSSIRLAVFVLILYYVSDSVKNIFGGFLWVSDNGKTFNSLLLLLQTVGLVLLWTVVNWAVSTLMGGIGKMREIFTVVCYSLTPLIVGNIIYIISTNVLLPSEMGFLSAIKIIFTLYTLFLIIVGTIKMHDYSFGRFVATTILTLVGIVIVIFILVILLILMQQTYGFVITLTKELIS